MWRRWRGGLPTGIDRVCLAYVEHFRSRASAVVQRRGHHFVLDATYSDRLFEFLCSDRKGFRSRFTALAAGALMAGNQRPQRGLLYLNVGHTGLNEPSLPQWVGQNGLRAVYFIHDLIPLTHPQYCRAGESDKHALRMANALVSATGVIGNSQATIDDLRAFATERGLPMPPAVAAFIAGQTAPEKLAPEILDRPYFLTLGTIEGRKNHILLLRIWESLARAMGDKVPALVIVGQRGWESAEAQRMLDGSDVLKRHVRELGSCNDIELAKLLAGARALLMPSFAEGYGLPVAEALAVGTPVIAGDLPVYREFAGDIPTYIDVLKVDLWQETIVKFVDDDPEWERQRQAVRSFTPPNWPSHFHRVDQWLSGLAEVD